MRWRVAFYLLEKCLDSEDFDGAHELADRIPDEPYRSAAFKMLVDSFLSTRSLEKHGKSIIDYAYFMAKKEVLDPSANEMLTRNCQYSREKLRMGDAPSGLPAGNIRIFTVNIQ